MGEDTGFIQAILAAPEDYSLRLIYADWLEEHDDPRGEYLRVLCEFDQATDEGEHTSLLRERLAELEPNLDSLWVAAMNRGLLRGHNNPQANHGSTRRRQRRNRREALEADVALFMKQYRRKAHKGHDPNDRGYSREVEKCVKRMKPEDLDRLLRGEED